MTDTIELKADITYQKPALRQRLLVIGPLPPPFAGPEIGTLAILHSDAVNERFGVRHINTTVRTSNTDKGRMDFFMVRAFVLYSWRLLRLLIGFRPSHVLYCPTSATTKGWVRDWITIALSSLFRAKIAIQFRGGHFRLFYDHQNAAVRALVGWALRRTAVVFVQADRLRPQFQGLVPDDRIRTLYNGIPNDFFRHFDGLDRGATLARNTPTVLFVGHLSFAKGYCDLLEAIAALNARHPAEYRFIGALQRVPRNVFYNQQTGARLNHTDPVEVYDRLIRGTPLESRISFLGDKVQGEQKISAFREADIFVLPSYSEGFSMAVLEAMAAGLAIVTTQVGAMPEILEDGVSGYVIAPGDRARLEACLGELIADPAKRLEMGRRAQEACRRRFLVEKMAENLVETLANT